MIGKGLAQGVAVVLFAELSQHGKDEAAAAQLEAEVFEDGLEGFAHTVLSTLYDVQCMASSTLLDFFKAGLALLKIRNSERLCHRHHCDELPEDFRYEARPRLCAAMR